MTGEYTLAWEGDQAASTTFTLDGDIRRHKGIAFEMRNAAPTSNGWSTVYTVPADIFMKYCDLNASPTNRLMLSPYDNQYSRIYYSGTSSQGITSIAFTYNNSRLRRVWWVD